MNATRFPHGADASPPNAPAGRRRAHGLGRRVLVGVLGLTLVMPLAACDLRLETPPLSEPTPDAQEVARRAAATDVSAIIDVATITLAGMKKKSRARSELTWVIKASQIHLEQLGGIYASGLDTENPGATAAPALPPGDDKPGEVKPVIADVVDRLAQSYSRTRGALESAPDPGLARLMASIATAQMSSATKLAAIAKIDLPDVALPGTPAAPSAPPSGVSTSVLSPLVSAEDSAGYAYEVLAARLTDAPRVAASARAVVHRDRASALALAAQVSGTPQDPRLVAYAIPAGFLAEPVDDAAAATLELNLTTSYATLVGVVVEPERAAYMDLLVESYQSALTWGAKRTYFPGMPEQS